MQLAAAPTHCCLILDHYSLSKRCHLVTVAVVSICFCLVLRTPHESIFCVGIRSASFMGDILTIGTGVGVLMFYDLRAGKYMESSLNQTRTVVLKASKGWVVSKTLHNCTI
jgi:hypothetical protein